MTIATSDKYIYLPTNLGTVAVPYLAPSEGEHYVNLPDGNGGYIAQKYSAPAEGDPFIYLPTNDGRFVALGFGIPSSPLPNELNLRVYTFPTVTTQHYWMAEWDSVVGSYDGFRIEYSTDGFSSNYGDGTLIGQWNSAPTSCYAWGKNPNSMHYFTAWGVSSTTPVSTSRSCAKLVDSSPLCTVDLSDYSTISGSLSEGESIYLLLPGCTGYSSQSGNNITLYFSGTSTQGSAGYWGFDTFGFMTYWNYYAKRVTFNLSRSDPTISLFSLRVYRNLWHTTTESNIVYYTTDVNWGSYNITFDDYADTLGFNLGVGRTTKYGSFSVSLSNITWYSS